MAIPLDKQKKLHFDLSNVGLRAHATAVGLLQLCLELRRAGVLDESAVDRIKGAIACDIEVSAPRSVATAEYRRDIKARLDKLFAGEEKIGSADALAFGLSAEDDGVCQGHA
ncbi:MULTISPECIES: hypothetical protein [Sphingomonadaceae]|uniref:Uncharacterized protein n=1 Tax=Sphingomonas bisphenolicum TaxID=296544 RepID=A0ABM7G103_9SPHN|nr:MULTISPECIES: hypothetical protein [Sphingomonadaceae]MBA4090437.1 hypothetical protein [Sphingobium sp.]MBZ9649339.1 hypothetical protein [Sphingobium sp. 3R8]BBF68199.1 hypothetical protein SBA_ch1_03990 [Sphingomonas bisphenolicum]